MCWQWAQYLLRTCREIGKQPLLLNLDETSVPVVFTHGKGNMMVQRGRRAWRTRSHQLVTSGQKRCFFTHVGIICNIPAIQPLLPQVIFVGAHNITVHEWSVVIREVPRHVYVKRMKKGWNNAEQHRIIMRILGMILAPFLHEM